MKPPAVFPAAGDPLRNLEDEAYESVEDAAEQDGLKRGHYREYAHIGGPICERNYRPVVLREWPLHTDYRPDNLNPRD